MVQRFSVYVEPIYVLVRAKSVALNFDVMDSPVTPMIATFSASFLKSVICVPMTPLQKPHCEPYEP